MKNILALFILIFLITPSFSFAEGRRSKNDVESGVKSVFENIRRAVAQKVKENKPVHLVQAKVTAKSGSSITVEENGKTYTVMVQTGTKTRRHFWGEGSFDEISVGDLLNIWGKFTDDAQSTIHATLIRNTSVMKRHGVFTGVVVSKGDTAFTLQSKERGEQNVTVSSSTKFVDNNGTQLSFTDVLENDMVRVQGVWDKEANTISEVTLVKKLGPR